MYRAYYVEEAWGDWTLVAVALDNDSGLAKHLRTVLIAALNDRKIRYIVSKYYKFPRKIKDMDEYKRGL